MSFSGTSGDIHCYSCENVITSPLPCLPEFTQDPYCPRCGLSMSEGDKKVQEDLAADFAGSMTLEQQPQQLTELSPKSLPQNQNQYQSQSQLRAHHQRTAPHTYDTTGGNISQEAQLFPHGVGRTPEDTLFRHNIHPVSLLPSQWSIFQRAEIGEQARLIRLWISSPKAMPTQVNTTADVMDQEDMDVE